MRLPELQNIFPNGELVASPTPWNRRIFQRFLNIYTSVALPPIEVPVDEPAMDLSLLPYTRPQ